MSMFHDYRRQFDGHPKEAELDKTIPIPTRAIHDEVWWRRFDLSNEAADQVFRRLASASLRIEHLPELTELIVEEIRAEYEKGNSFGFTIGLITSEGNKLVNWARLHAATYALQMEHPFEVISTTFLPMETELTLGARHSQEDFAKHWDHVVDALGDHGRLDQRSGYLFVTDGATLSYGARREIKRAHQINMAGEEQGALNGIMLNSSPLITVRAANSPPLEEFYGVAKLETIIHELEALKDHPSFDDKLKRDLKHAKRMLAVIEEIKHDANVVGVKVFQEYLMEITAETKRD